MKHISRRHFLRRDGCRFHRYRWFSPLLAERGKAPDWSRWELWLKVTRFALWVRHQ